MNQLALFSKKEIEQAPPQSRNPNQDCSPTPPSPTPTQTLSPTPRKTKQKAMETKSQTAKIYENLITKLREYFQKHNFRTGIIGLSGGIDSSVTLKLAVDALGAENVIGVIMPEIGLTKQENIDHAKELAKYLGVTTYYQPINAFIIDFKIVSWKPSELAQMNTRARIRAVLLYSLANTLNSLVLGTSNKSEIMLGYGTKYGDLAADIEVIGDLYKTEVYELARYLKFSDVLINKTPSAELKPNHTDEEDLGATYEELDNVLKKFEQGSSVEELIDRGMNPVIIHRTARLMAVNKHKRAMPPTINVHE